MTARIFVARDLLADVPQRAYLSRRTLVTAEVTEDIAHFLQVWPRPPADDPKRPDQLRKPGRITVLSVLLDIQDKGFVESIEQVAGGFWVRMKSREAVQ